MKRRELVRLALAGYVGCRSAQADSRPAPYKDVTIETNPKGNDLLTVR